jgi:DNA topoisomerase-6 subunit B
MTSYQSTFDEGEGMAEELAADQRSISIAEFFEKNRQMLGFDSGARALVTAVKEAVDNSLTWSTPFVYRDAGETKHAPIGDVVDDLMDANRESVEIKRGGDLQKLRVDGFEALSFDEDYAVDFQRVSSVFRHRVNSDIYRITVEGGREVELTDYHSVFVLRDGEITSVETNQITTDDYVVLPDSTWGDWSKHRIDLVDELLALDPERTESVGIYGVEHLIENYRSEILEQVSADYRISDFRKCDRLPLNIVRTLGLDAEEYADCRIGYQYGRNNIPAVLPVTDKLAELLGLYVAEGCVAGTDHEKVYLSLGSHESALIEYAETLVESVFDVEPSTVAAHETATNVTIPSKIAGLVFEEVFAAGDSASEKRLPRFVLDFSPYKRQRFFIGYAAGDGYPTAEIGPVLRGGGGIERIPAGRVTVATTSEGLASGLRYLLSSVDYDATYEHEPPESRQIDGRTVTFSGSHVLHVRTDQSGTSRARLPAEHLLESVTDPKLAYDLDERQSRVDVDHALALADGGSVEFANRGRAIAAGDLTALPVTDIETVEYSGEWVYDVSVPGDENFMAGTAPLACHNSLDACEEAGIEPDVYVEIDESGDYYRLVVEDNGPGVTKEQIPKIFGKLLYGSRFHKREQNRGQQGIGISAAVLYSQLTSGKPARVISKTHGADEAQVFEVAIDTDSNEPEIESEDTTSWDRPHGTRIELEMEGNMRARQSLHDYIKHTAVVNPHARIELREPKEHFKYERATDQLPEETEEIRPHPHGVELGTLQKMLEATDSYSVSGFLQGEFTRVGGKTAQNVVDNFRDRHFGREMTWRPPESHEDADIEAAITEAVANKGAEATADFAGRVTEELGSGDRIAHHHVVAVVDEVAEDIEEDHDKSFGSTVRENAVAAAWEQITAERTADVYSIVDEATTKRKDDAHVQGLAERIAAKFENRDDDPRDRVSYDVLHDYVAKSADDTEEYDDATFGETARENVTDAIWDHMETVPDDTPNVGDIEADRDTASELLDAMRAADIIAPPTDCLSPITADLVEAGLKKEFDADFYSSTTRDASVHGGDPFIVEAGIAYGGDLDDASKADVMRFANRVPLVYQRGACAITDVIKEINWRNYKLDQPGGRGIPNGSVVIMVHVASTNVPFTSESKDAVANIPEIEDEVERAIRESARDLKSFLKKRRSMEKRRRKQDKLATILPAMAEKLEEVTGEAELNIDDSLARIMNNVLVDREQDDDGVRLIVENNSSTNADLEVTDILSTDPGDVEGASVVEMDGEYFVQWETTVKSGEEASIEYELNGDVEFSTPEVDGIEDEKLTVNA